MQFKLEYIERFNQPRVKPDAVVILLHGLGADYNDFEPLVHQLPVKKSIKFIFPNAPIRPITINGGYKMRGWYDIRDFGNLANLADDEGITQSVSLIEDLINQQINSGIRSDKIILAGFSQGGAISYITSINTKYKLGGVLVLSSYLPAVSVDLGNSINKHIPFFVIHGTQDSVVPYFAGLDAYNKLKSYGYNIKWAEYNMPHSLCLEEVADIAKWLDTIID